MKQRIFSMSPTIHDFDQTGYTGERLVLTLDPHTGVALWREKGTHSVYRQDAVRIV